MTPQAALLRRRIEDTGGPVDVAEFIAMALSHPEHGYYATRDRFGRAGDFVTAPEISGAFGELLGLWCVEIWRLMGMPAPVRLVELGAGRGTMIADAWRAAVAAAPEFSRAVRLHIIESSPLLRERQRASMANLPSPPSEPCWHMALQEVPPGPLLALANEFFDALPVRQWVRRGGVWRERQIGLADDGESFAFVDGPVSTDDPTDGYPDAPEEGCVFERCPQAEFLAKTIGARLAADGGAALIIDYGHAHSGFGETLQAVRGHHFADPLTEPGETDLSHHVDFQRLRAVAEAAGAQSFGPIPQGLFLGRLGIAIRGEAMAAAAASPAQAEAIRGAIRRLVHPGRMGLLFKAFAITGAAPATPPPGFDRRRT